MTNMKRSIAVAALALPGLAACGERETLDSPNVVATEPANSATGENSDASAGWQLLSSGEGVALRLAKTGGAPTIHLFCPARSGKLVVNVAAFRPIASEERLSFGSEEAVVALVADSRGDALRGGVTGEAPVPAELSAILAGPISASYGAQSVGPISSPDEADRAAFLAACGERAPAPMPPKTARSVAACHIQDGVRLTAKPLRATGTEPFWSARIDGRCVTYSTPENQAGTRIWTRYSDGATWSGALDGRQFELRTRAAPGCSDGMSDNRYPIAVTLRVGGETRQGCAKPD